MQRSLQDGPVDSDPPGRIELPEPPPKLRRRTKPLLVLVIVMVGVIVAVLIALNGDRNTEWLPWAPGPVEAWAPGHYEGPSVSFDYPKDWYEFYLEAGWQQFAAYGPVTGGDDDFVAVFPAPSETEGMSREDFVRWSSSESGGALSGSTHRSGPPLTVEVNGLYGYMTTVTTEGERGQALGRRMILLKGERDDYVIACQYGVHATTQVLAACTKVMDTLVETPSRDDAGDPSGCTDTELSLLSSVLMPEGTDVTGVRGLGRDGSHSCDLRGVVLSDREGDFVDSFRARMSDAGWDSEEARIVRTFESYEVWRVIGMRDWDWYMVEVYVTDGLPHHFFVTTGDG